MIDRIYLFTNRNTVFFDERGEQMCDLMGSIGWKPIPSYEDYKVKETLEKVVLNKPKIYLAKWQDWSQEINVEEFCCLLGYGPWYWEYKKNADYENNN